MKNLRYIGPFLRINSLSIDNVKNQLDHFTKESLKHIALNSRCGITTPLKDLKIPSSPNIDINIFKENSLLLCMYKKSDGKVLKNKYGLYWDENTFKKDINVSSNILFTLNLLNISNYYYKLETLDKKLYSLGVLYSNLCKCQLDFYYKYLRNEDGIFVDKKNLSPGSSKNISLESTDNVYKVSDQGFIMLVNYLYSIDPNSRDSSVYKDFSSDILNMLIHYRDELYEVSHVERATLLLSLNLFCNYSNDDSAKELLMDLMDYHFQCFLDENRLYNYDDFKELPLNLINICMYQKFTGLENFNKQKDDILEILDNLYDEKLGVLMKKKNKKEFKIYASDINLFLSSLILCNEDNKFDMHIVDFYKKHFIDSNLIPSWPDCPNLDSVERYNNFSLKADDLISDSNFRPNSILPPESSGFAPIMYKSVYYNTKKCNFSKIKSYFDSYENMFSLFINLYTINSHI